MKLIGITGQPGFIGTHLFNYLGLFKDQYKLRPFEDGFFSDPAKLRDWVSGLDAIVHLAAMNRHGDPQVIFDTNIRLVGDLISALEATGSTPQVLFSSSTQEERDNPYGRSKREGREMLINWAARNNASFTGLIIPNVYGPFGHPYYNSVVATFCHQLTHGETPFIDIDGLLKLIYVGELTQVFRHHIDQETNSPAIFVPHTVEKRVSEILNILQTLNTSYLTLNTFPSLPDPFHLNLFNTLRCFMDIRNHYPVKLKMNTDNRGTFVETIRAEMGGQVSFSTTKPGITRGNHFHARKIERFAVISGQARIQLRRIGTTEVLNFDLSGDEPAFVDMPIWYTHNITNTGTTELLTIFWINEFFNPDDPDTFFEVV